MPLRRWVTREVPRGVRTRLVGGVLVVALRLVGRVSEMFYPAPSIEEQIYQTMREGGMRLRVIARQGPGGTIWQIADTDGTPLPGSWPTPEEAGREARAAEAIIRDVDL